MRGGRGRHGRAAERLEVLGEALVDLALGAEQHAAGRGGAQRAAEAPGVGERPPPAPSSSPSAPSSRRDTPSGGELAALQALHVVGGARLVVPARARSGRRARRRARATDSPARSRSDGSTAGHRPPSASAAASTRADGRLGADLGAGGGVVVGLGRDLEPGADAVGELVAGGARPGTRRRCVADAGPAPGVPGVDEVPEDLVDGRSCVVPLLELRRSFSPRERSW